MTAYLIVEIEINDADSYAEYIRLVPPTITAFGGRYLARGGHAELLEGEDPPKRIVLLEFPSMDQAKAWLDGSEYRPARDIRHRAARTRMVLVEGSASV